VLVEEEEDNRKENMPPTTATTTRMGDCTTQREFICGRLMAADLQEQMSTTQLQSMQEIHLNALCMLFG